MWSHALGCYRLGPWRDELIPCGPLTPYGVVVAGHHWFRWWLIVCSAPSLSAETMHTIKSNGNVDFKMSAILFWCYCVNTLRPRQNGRHFPDEIFKWIFLNENVWISINGSLTFVPRGPINNIPTLVQVMAWRRPGDKPLSEPMMVYLLTHICVTRPQWVKDFNCLPCYMLWQASNVHFHPHHNWIILNRTQSCIIRA